jgi:hypothetical protein
MRISEDVGGLVQLIKTLPIVVGLAALTCSGLNASVIIGNSLAGPFNFSTNFGIKGAGFTVGSSAVTITSVMVALEGTSCAANCSVEFDVYNNNGGVPGSSEAIVGTPSVTPLAGAAVLTITPATGILLSANTTHWLVYKPGSTFVGWDTTTPQSAPSGAFASFVGYEFDSSGTGTSYNPSAVFNSFEIDGTVATAATPEPASFGFVLLGVGWLFYGRRQN